MSYNIVSQWFYIQFYWAPDIDIHKKYILHIHISEYNTTFEACSGIEIALSGYPVTEIMNFVPGGSSDMFDINGSLFTVIF